MNTLHICLALEMFCVLGTVFLAGYACKEKEFKWMWIFIAYSLWIVALMIWELITK
jgi:hypothetical protein